MSKHCPKTQWVCKSKNRVEEPEYSYEEIASIRDYLQGLTDIKPKVGIICGSGLGFLAELASNSFQIDYKNIPNFPTTSAPGHAGKFIFGYISAEPILIMQGRFHFYEGYALSTCIMPVRLMKLLGVIYLIASNAAGGLNPSFKVGDIMLLKDHLNVMGMAGNTPLRGPNDPRWGTRFPSMISAYDQDIINGIKDIAEKIGLDKNVHEGIYAGLGGPSYETVAECNALRTLGADAVGMSTVHEITAARHCNIKCFAFSLICNVCPSEYNNAPDVNEDEVLQAAKANEVFLKDFVQKVIEYIGKLT